MPQHMQLVRQREACARERAITEAATLPAHQRALAKMCEDLKRGATRSSGSLDVDGYTAL